MPFITLLLAVAAVLVFYVVSVYNSLAKMRVQIKEAWSGIDVQLKRRIDLIPNLVETVKGYASHEKELFENVAKARAALMNAGSAKEANEANNMLSGALKSLFAVAENYPELKASDNFKQLQGDLTDTEDKIAYSRQFYNSTVRDFNAKIVMFPNNVIAGMFGFKQEEFFEAEEADKEPVKVQF